MSIVNDDTLCTCINTYNTKDKEYVKCTTCGLFIVHSYTVGIKEWITNITDAIEKKLEKSIE